eukprot:g19620.t1
MDAKSMFSYPAEVLEHRRPEVAQPKEGRGDNGITLEDVQGRSGATASTLQMSSGQVAKAYNYRFAYVQLPVAILKKGAVLSAFDLITLGALEAWAFTRARLLIWILVMCGWPWTAQLRTCPKNGQSMLETIFEMTCQIQESAQSSLNKVVAQQLMKLIIDWPERACVLLWWRMVQAHDNCEHLLSTWLTYSTQFPPAEWGKGDNYKQTLTPGRKKAANQNDNALEWGDEHDLIDMGASDSGRPPIIDHGARETRSVYHDPNQPWNGWYHGTTGAANRDSYTDPSSPRVEEGLDMMTPMAAYACDPRANAYDTSDLSAVLKGKKGAKYGPTKGGGKVQHQAQTPGLSAYSPVSQPIFTPMSGSSYYMQTPGRPAPYGGMKGYTKGYMKGKPAWTPAPPSAAPSMGKGPMNKGAPSTYSKAASIVSASSPNLPSASQQGSFMSVDEYAAGEWDMSMWYPPPPSPAVWNNFAAGKGKKGKYAYNPAHYQFGTNVNHDPSAGSSTDRPSWSPQMFHSLPDSLFPTAPTREERAHEKAKAVMDKAASKAAAIKGKNKAMSKDKKDGGSGAKGKNNDNVATAVAAAGGTAVKMEPNAAMQFYDDDALNNHTFQGTMQVFGAAMPTIHEESQRNAGSTAFADGDAPPETEWELVDGEYHQVEDLTGMNEQVGNGNSWGTYIENIEQHYGDILDQDEAMFGAEPALGVDEIGTAAGITAQQNYMAANPPAGYEGGYDENGLPTDPWCRDYNSDAGTSVNMDEL